MNHRRSFAITANIDPAALVTLAQFYESHGIPLNHSYGELFNTLVEEALVTHNLSITTISQEQAIEALNSLGFSTKQLNSSRGVQRMARRAKLEELAHTSRDSPSSIPEHLRRKLDGEDETQWSDEELQELLELNLITPAEIQTELEKRDTLI